METSVTEGKEDRRIKFCVTEKLAYDFKDCS
jgi:hypothetical protein